VDVAADEDVGFGFFQLIGFVGEDEDSLECFGFDFV
jgi:hypothetical protein